VSSPRPDETAGDLNPRPWDRQPDEGARSYALFRAWLRAGPAARSLKAVAREAGESHSGIKTMAMRGAWTSRSRGYDAAVEREHEALHQARLRKAIDQRSRAILAGVAAIRLGALRILRDLQADPGARIKPIDTKFLQWALTELRLETGGATERVEVKETGESLDGMIKSLEYIILTT
jgi:hypothetical protein